VNTHYVDALVLDAVYRQSLAAVRSYGRAGWRVGAVSCESDASWAPALRSRWCSLAAVVPDLADSPDAYIDGLLTVVKESGAKLVVPAHDGTIESIRARRRELESIAPVGLADENALAIAVSKSRTTRLAEDLGVRTPRSVHVQSDSDLGAAIAEIGLPAVIKPEQSWMSSGRCGRRLSAVVLTTPDNAKARINELLAVGGEALLQEWVPGRREAVSLFYADGRFWAELAQVSWRDWPLMGGASVLCETIPLLPDIAAPAEQIVRTMQLEGCSMVEFRRDLMGRPVLMEVNPRMGGSVALAIAAGVDLPMLLLRWTLGLPLQAITSYDVGRRLRWLAGDVWHLKSTFDGPAQPDLVSRASATRTFILDFFRPTTFDVLDRHDLSPAIAELDTLVIQHAKRRLTNRMQLSTTASRKVAYSMGPSSIDVAIIGAGPNGLGVAAYLRKTGLRFRIFGSAMKTWRDMPERMNLKSLGFATSIPHPDGHPTFPEYCQANDLEDYEPIEFSTFADYGMQFQSRFVPEVEDTTVTRVERSNGRFLLTLATGERLSAGQVVVAVGLTYFAYVPDVFANLPPDRITHTWGQKNFAAYRDKDVVVVGGGSSALETATLLHEHGARVQVLARTGAHWGGRVPRDAKRSLIERLKLPVSSLGHGRENWVLQHAPGLMHHVPSRWRIPFTQRHLGPGVAWWLRDRADGPFPIHEQAAVTKATFSEGRARLLVERSEGETEIDADHVLVGTGYVFDLDRLSFVDTSLSQQIERHQLGPKLSRHFESSVPGLYFIGPVAAESFGPLVRFVAGAPYAVPKVTRRIAHRARPRARAFLSVGRGAQAPVASA
jgi:cation diffusion facilitator CzcD-associated flavoprotein CzcO/predicted ATP-grasp superfamily ATP-dependent carboligase